MSTLVTPENENPHVTLCANDVHLCLGGVEILRGISCEVVPGKTTAVVGANGSGKSSLLRTLTGEYSPNKGSVSFDGSDISNFSPLVQAQRRALMSQNPSVAFDFLVSEILEMGWVQDVLPRKFFDDSYVEIARLCGIEEFLSRKFNGLSGGEQQRVHFARALLQVWNATNDQNSRYLLLDEPTSNLDLAYELEILKLTKLVSHHGVGILVVLHDLNLAARFADYVYLLVGGSVFREGIVSDVFTEEVLSQTYQVPIKVERLESLDRLLVIAN